ncbi:hypothetical protein 1 [Changjiang polero-like virus 1]|uniref:hypothetical protein 1 n=1 Tax=Changjiang polero-like virus 1 TaxID=1922799 RepID=UPI00090988B0|nr:hypothetical protein 1 [Changjiang polero-like virus 1]APG75728.1 hypothetical protein 1 [Changjiang polero-like virus 1]
MVIAISWMFGGLPGFLFGVALWLLKSGWRVLTSGPSYMKEKAVAGYLSYTIPQEPPKKSIVLIQNSDGSHAGYGTCVRLYNGETALLTADHVYDPALLVVSARNGTKVPLSQFQPVVRGKETDLIILRGPPNWEGLLATKAVQTVPVSQLAKSKFSLYSFDGAWQATNGELVGVEGGFATTLCNTTPGFSGTPLFSGKRVVGVHVGASKKANVNLMAPIPSIAGLTSPQYVFETTAPTGRLFTSDEAVQLSETFQVLHSELEKVLNFKSQSGKQWSEMLDIETTPTAPTPAVKAPVPAIQGNEPRGADRVINGEATVDSGSTVATRRTSPVDGEDILAKLMASLMSKVDVKSIEKEAIRMISEKALKAPRRRGPRKPRTSRPSSIPTTPGKYVPPQRRVTHQQASSGPANSPASTTLNKEAKQSGGKHSPGTIQRWVRKSEASAGRCSAPKQS